MAKPQHTCYQVMADHDDWNGEPVALHDSCVKRDTLQVAGRASRFNRKERLSFTHTDRGVITFGFDPADKLLRQCRQAAKEQFKKGDRPAFYLRKMTMSDFMAHPGFKDYENNSTVKTVFKKYHLMDLLSKKGFQA